MEFALYAPDRRLTLSFPSPFLRNEPAVLEIEGGEAGTARSWRTEEVVSYESGFKRELVAFHDCVVSGAAPVTSGPGRPAGHRAVPGDHRVPPQGRAGRRPGRHRRGKGQPGEHTDRGPGAIAVANAPVSYGAFEITVGHDPNVPDGISVLDQVAEAGYAGIDLGPVGYLGSGARLGELLAERGLGLAGAYLELPYADPGALEQAMPRAGRPAGHVRRGAAVPAGPAAAADAGRRRQPASGAASPAGPPRTPRSGWTRDGWRRFAAGLARVIGRCRDRGYEPTFHPETGTYVEAPWEIEEVLDLSDIGLCLETGHMMLGGGDPVAMLRDWGERVNHVHLKDAVLSVMDGIIADEAPVTEIWSREAFCALGHGDLDVDAHPGRPAGHLVRRLAGGGAGHPAAQRASGSRGPPRNSGTTAPFSPNGGCDMPPSFRLGLIGAGRMGRTHLRAFAGSGRVAVTAIAEVSAATRRTVEASGAALYPGVGQMLDGAAVDGVLITAPSDQHGADHRRSRRAGPADPVREAVRGDRRADPRGGRDRRGGGGAVPGRLLAALRARRCGSCGSGWPPASWAPSTWWPATSGIWSRRRRRSAPTAAAS